MQKPNISREENRKWMEHIKQEFQLLVAEKEMDLSPCSCMRESLRIWIIEKGNVPFLERQVAFNRNIPFLERQSAFNKNINLSCET